MTQTWVGVRRGGCAKIGGMQGFEGKIAVVTGGASGMGRQLVLQLVEAGCHVATCDLSADELNETRAMALEIGAERAGDDAPVRHLVGGGDPRVP